MMACVVDASVVIAAFAPDEEGITAVGFDRLASDGLVVPPHWPLEVANAFAVGIRRGRFGADTFRLATGVMAQYRIEVDGVDLWATWGTVFDFAGRAGLTLYDAAYADLARRRALPLATLDRRLVQGASAAGVALVDLRSL